MGTPRSKRRRVGLVPLTPGVRLPPWPDTEVVPRCERRLVCHLPHVSYTHRRAVARALRYTKTERNVPLFRLNQSSYEESVRGTREVQDRKEIALLLTQNFGYLVEVDPADLVIEAYGTDNRSPAWYGRVYTVTLGELGVVGFTNRPL